MLFKPSMFTIKYRHELSMNEGLRTCSKALWSQQKELCWHTWFQTRPLKSKPCYFSVESCQKETSNCITSKLQVSNKYFTMSDLPGSNQGYVSMSIVDRSSSVFYQTDSMNLRGAIHNQDSQRTRLLCVIFLLEWSILLSLLSWLINGKLSFCV